MWDSTDDYRRTITQTIAGAGVKEYFKPHDRIRSQNSEAIACRRKFFLDLLQNQLLKIILCKKFDCGLDVVLCCV